jgi:hypothetical protein
MMDSTIRKIIHNRRRKTTAIITTNSYRQNRQSPNRLRRHYTTLVEEVRPLRLVSNRCSVTAIAEEVLDGSGTTKLLDEQTADEKSSLFSLPNRFSKSDIRF